MASTKADGNRVVWTYTDDAARDWAVSAKAVYVLDATDGAKYGGSAASASTVAKPRQLRMRAVKCVSSAGKAIYIPVYSTSAALWTTAGTTVTRDLNGTDTIFTATSTKRGERYRDTTRQTA